MDERGQHKVASAQVCFADKSSDRFCATVAAGALQHDSLLTRMVRGAYRPRREAMFAVFCPRLLRRLGHFEAKAWPLMSRGFDELALSKISRYALENRAPRGAN